MPTSYLVANTYGIGDLIRQKKRLKVPPHQRDFSWTRDEIETFIDDITRAVDEETQEYFLGLVVLQGPNEGQWEILDGQQRLTTISMIYSALRLLFQKRKLQDDATQVVSDYLAVRKLGGDEVPRLVLNFQNRLVFEKSVVRCDDLKSLKDTKGGLSKSTSNFKLVDGMIFIHQMLKNWVERDSVSPDEQTQKLYSLSVFLESGAKVVCLEVDSDVDAYIVFEALNYRGHDLSALDLVKNHLYSFITAEDLEEVASNWMTMRANIGDRFADDFLKLYWTSMVGRVSKSYLFKALKDSVINRDQALELSGALSKSSEIYSALEDSKHSLWLAYSPFCRHLIGKLVVIRSKLVRPIIFASIKKEFSSELLEQVLWLLLVIAVRYIAVKKGRTGLLETRCSEVSSMIMTGEITSFFELENVLHELIVSDEEFEKEFQTYTETNSQRALYFLSTMEASLQANQPDYSEIYEQVDAILDGESGVSVSYLANPRNIEIKLKITDDEEDSPIDIANRIGNRFLSTSLPSNSDFPALKALAEKSEFLTTKRISSSNDFVEAILDRQEFLANLAVKVWTIEKTN